VLEIHLTCQIYWIVWRREISLKATSYIYRRVYEVNFYKSRLDRIFTYSPHSTFSMKEALYSKISKGVQVLQNILFRHVVMFCFVTGLGCHYSQLLFILQKHFQCQNQNYSRLSLSVNTQPCSSPLYMFFPCWVCYGVAMWTVFQPYLSTIHVQTDIKKLSELW